MKKLAALFVTFLMLCTMFPMVWAAEAGILVGDSDLFAPPVGVRSAITYTLYDAAGGTVQEDATLSVSGDVPAGVTVANNKLVLDGSAVRAGKFTITMANAAVSQSKQVTICDVRIQEDFESFEQGATVGGRTLKKLDGTVYDGGMYQNTTAHVETDTDGGKFAGCIGQETLSIRPDWVGVSQNTRFITFKARAKMMLKDWCTIFKFADDQGHDIVNFYRKRRTEGYWTSYRDENGGGTEKTIYGAPAATQWADLRLVLDRYNGVYTIWANDQVVCDNYKVNPAVTAANYIARITSEACIDDIELFSGTELLPQTGVITGDDYIITPPAGIRTKLSYDLFASSEAETAESGATMSLVGAPAGITVSGHDLILDGSAINTAASFTIKMANADYTATKTVTMCDKRIYDDFESLEEGAAIASAKTLKKVDGTAYTAGSMYHTQDAGTTATVAVEANGNHYAGGGNLMIMPDWVGAKSNMKHYTASAKVKITGDWQRAMSLHGKNSSTEQVMGDLWSRLTQDGWMTTSGPDGTTTNKYYYCWKGSRLPNSEWAEIAIEVDMENLSYTVKEGGVTLFENYKMRAGNASDMWLRMIRTGEASIDEIAVYSGTPIEEATAVSDYTVKVNGTEVSSYAGALTDGAVVTASAAVANNAWYAKKYVMHIAEYDADGRLVKTTPAAISLEGNTESDIVGEVTIDAKTDSVKVMLWEGKLVKPLAAAPALTK